MAIRQTIEVYRAEDILLDFTMDTGEDISGWTLLLTVSERDPKVSQDVVPDQTTLFSKAGVLTDAANGKFRFTIDSADLDIATGNFYHDVWRTDSGSERVLSEGPFNIEPIARHPLG